MLVAGSIKGEVYSRVSPRKKHFCAIPMEKIKRNPYKKNKLLKGKKKAVTFMVNVT